MKPTFTASALVFSVVALGALLGCQTYDFEPVSPLAVAQTTQGYNTVGTTTGVPHMMLVVDKSGSMNTTDPGATASRMQDLQTAMSNFLNTYGTVASMALTRYPQGSGCANTVAIDVNFPATEAASDLQNTANNIRTAIQGTTPAGGTPTSNAVAFAATSATLKTPNRDDFILLLTDGLPNCNGALDPNTCTCSSGASCVGQAATQCLDDTGVVATINGIRTQDDIKTIVVGFGADVAGGAAGVTLQAMAVAGGFPRSCPGGTDAECGAGNTCNTTAKTCSKAYYQAANATELGVVLANIVGIVNTVPCDYALAVTPSNPGFVSVLVNGTVTTSGPDTWQLLPPNDGACGVACPHGEVKFVGNLCAQANGATRNSPMRVEIRLLQAF